MDTDKPLRTPHSALHSKKVYFNKPQRLTQLISANTTVIVAGRRTGKTDRGSSSSLTLSWLLVDEAKFIDYQKLKDETLSANGEIACEARTTARTPHRRLRRVFSHTVEATSWSIPSTSERKKLPYHDSFFLSMSGVL